MFIISCAAGKQSDLLSRQILHMYIYTSYRIYKTIHIESKYYLMLKLFYNCNFLVKYTYEQ